LFGAGWAAEPRVRPHGPDPGLPASPALPQLAFDSEGIALTSTMGFIKSPVGGLQARCRCKGHMPAGLLVRRHRPHPPAPRCCLAGHAVPAGVGRPPPRIAAQIRPDQTCRLASPRPAPLQISTVNMGLAVGWAAVVLSFGKKGWRKSLPHSLGACRCCRCRCRCRVRPCTEQPSGCAASTAACTPRPHIWCPQHSPAAQPRSTARQHSPQHRPGPCRLHPPRPARSHAAAAARAAHRAAAGSGGAHQVARGAGLQARAAQAAVRGHRLASGEARLCGWQAGSRRTLLLWCLLSAPHPGPMRPRGAGAAPEA
jgi:hypothetical protein